MAKDDSKLVLDEPKLVQAVVAPRRSLAVETGIAGVHRRAGPGEIVLLRQEEVASLRALGFLTAGGVAPAPEPTRVPPIEARPTINGKDGSTIGPDGTP